MYYRAYLNTKDKFFKEASEYWLQEGIKLGKMEDGALTYKKWSGIEKGYQPELSLLEGVAGIGLVMIHQLADFEMNWDECLLLN